MQLPEGHPTTGLRPTPYSVLCFQLGTRVKWGLLGMKGLLYSELIADVVACQHSSTEMADNSPAPDEELRTVDGFWGKRSYFFKGVDPGRSTMLH